MENDIYIRILSYAIGVCMGCIMIQTFIQLYIANELGQIKKLLEKHNGR